MPEKEKRKVCAVIVAAGSSTRVKAGDKLYMPLGGEPVLLRTLKAFQSSPEVDAIVLTARGERVEEVRRLAEKNGINKLISVVAGGKTRAESVENGIKMTEGFSLLLIHDGARPLVEDGLIERVISVAEEYGAAVPAVPVKDTVKLSDGDGFVAATPDRSRLFAAQTPQGFLRSLYLKALSSVGEEAAAVTDDSSIFELAGYRVRLVEGAYTNIKLTTDSDFAAAEAYLRSKEND